MYIYYSILCPNAKWFQTSKSYQVAKEQYSISMYIHILGSLGLEQYEPYERFINHQFLGAVQRCRWHDPR